MVESRSYSESFLEKRVVSLENELLQIKSTQNYGTNQIIPRESRSAEQAAILRSDIGLTDVYCLVGKVKFVGVNKNKLARGCLSWEITSIDTPALSEFVLGSITFAPSSRDNEMQWNVRVLIEYVPVPGGSSPSLPRTCPFSAVFKVSSNMSGVVTYEGL